MKQAQLTLWPYCITAMWPEMLDRKKRLAVTFHILDLQGHFQNSDPEKTAALVHVVCEGLFRIPTGNP